MGSDAPAPGGIPPTCNAGVIGTGYHATAIPLPGAGSREFGTNTSGVDLLHRPARRPSPSPTARSRTACPSNSAGPPGTARPQSPLDVPPRKPIQLAESASAIMTKNVRLLLTLLALGGLASALASLYVHHQLLTQPGYLSFCDVNATVSCTQVYQSRYAYLAGVPVALLGALWYVGRAAGTCRIALGLAEPAGEQPGLRLPALHRRPRVRALHGVRVARAPQDGLPDVCGHVRRRGRVVHHLGNKDAVPHGHDSPPPPPGCQGRPGEPGCAGADPRVRRRRHGRHRVLPARRRHGGVTRRPGRARPTARASSSGSGNRRCGPSSRCRPTGRPWSS